ncbi:NUDIX domain-containing protein [Pseudomonas frederiksbergensis]|uniref:NUDIX domain-containing protein n=1 Tax=Pseudomonas frederiksbergensis TaxID=104087 RepID=UPI001980DB6B|nr:NUDIX domain-containing protein [Pseudomonas frederiksbergensis]MBN3865709.1 NUDIX domain-containing protein [Pseudomonas frederiksbergensis]
MSTSNQASYSTTPNIRIIARGVLLRNEKILIIKVKDKGGEWWILPGGGQDFGETLQDCLIRECNEELGISVNVGPCIMVREFIGTKKNTVIGDVSNKQFLELYFFIHTTETPDLIPRDPGHLSLEWVDVEKLSSLNFFPKIIIEKLSTNEIDSPIYVGDAD